MTDPLRTQIPLKEIPTTVDDASRIAWFDLLNSVVPDYTDAMFDRDWEILTEHKRAKAAH